MKNGVFLYMPQRELSTGTAQPSQMLGSEKLSDLLGRSIPALGCDFWGLELASSRNGKVGRIRLFIDASGGVTLQMCERVSHYVQSLLVAEGWGDEPPALEVSSPGLERRLFTLEQCRKYLGEKVALRLHGRLNDKVGSRLRACLDSVEGAKLRFRLEEDGPEEAVMEVDWSQVERIRLVSQMPSNVSGGMN